jgi:hypothetical protein
MKHFYITLHYLFFALCFLQCLFSGRSYGQTLVIDDTAPRITSVASNGQDLTATTYNYVRIPDLLSIDSLKTDGTFYRHLFMVWGTGIETATPLPALCREVKMHGHPILERRGTWLHMTSASGVV